MPRGHAALPGCGLVHAVANEGHEQCRRAADHEHPAPPVLRADEIVRERGEEEAEVVAGVHVARALLAAILRPFFGDERAAHGPLAADADAGQNAERRKLPDRGRDTAQEGEQRVAQDRQHQGLDAAEAIRDRTPQHRQTPPDEEQREQHAAVVADVARGRGNPGSRQQLDQCRREHERVDERIHPVERPAAPRGPQPPNLIARERRACEDVGCGHAPGSIQRFIDGFGLHFLHDGDGVLEKAGPHAASIAIARLPNSGDVLYEIVNFVDGKRTVGAIRDAVSAEFEPIRLAAVAEYLDVLAGTGAITFKQ